MKNIKGKGSFVAVKLTQWDYVNLIWHQVTEKCDKRRQVWGGGSLERTPTVARTDNYGGNCVTEAEESRFQGCQLRGTS